MNQFAIEIKNLTKIYSFGFWGKKQKSLDQLNLNVPKNSIYGFLGANGAGKTTAIKLLIGLQFPSQGEISILGNNPNDPNTKARIGFMPERPYLHETLNANEFLNFHRDLFGGLLKGKKIPSNEELLALVGLSGLQGKYLKDFSKGMLQRIGIAQALVNDPELVILDEPMSGLDPIGRKEIRDLIVKLSEKGKTIFFSSHILSDIESICHRIAFLEKGVLKKEGSVSEMLHSKSKAIEILFSGINQNALESNLTLSTYQKSGELFLIKGESDELGKKLAQEIWKAGGKIVSYQAAHSSLEDVLFGDGK